jgi:molybdopterin molybdotransferase
MISYSRAFEIAIKTAASFRKRTKSVPLAESVGLVLAREVVSDIDIPPFNRAAMDGYAVRSEDIANVPVELEVIDTLPAGQVSDTVVGRGCAVRIMT